MKKATRQRLLYWKWPKETWPYDLVKEHYLHVLKYIHPSKSGGFRRAAASGFTETRLGIMGLEVFF